MRRLVVLMRHAESEKNVDARYSGGPESDRLSDLGLSQGSTLAADVASFLQTLKIDSCAIACSDTRRARDTLEPLASQYGCTVRALPTLNSIDPGSVSNLTERETKEIYPAFWKQVELYRAGLLSSYDILYPEGAEELPVFELRVSAAIKSVIEGTESRVIFIVAHRSTLTAALIGFARRFYGYPKDFFGFVPIEPAKSYGVLIDPPKGEILWTNLALSAVSRDQTNSIQL